MQHEKRSTVHLVIVTARLVPDPLVARHLDAFLDRTACVQTHRIALAIRQHAVEHDDLALLRDDTETLRAALVGRRGRQATSTRKVGVASLATSDMYQKTVIMRFL